MAIREIQDQPADLIRRYRVLCEASGIARASRVPLALAVQSELADLQRQITRLLADSTPSAGGPVDLPRQREVAPAAPRALTSVPRPSPEPETVEEAPATRPEDLTATIFTDGAAEGNPGPGGYCALVRIPGRPDRELSGSSIHTTNNKMELSAAIAGLRAAADAGIAGVTVISDSEYLVKG
ncbi:MAG: RNase H family protein, partial [Chloroflexota bacterium]